jgi:hypothetical protein
MLLIFSVSGGTPRCLFVIILREEKKVEKHCPRRPLPVRNEKQVSMASFVWEWPRMKTKHVTTRNSHQVIWVNGLGSNRVTGSAVLWVWTPSWLSSSTRVYSTRVYSTRLWVKRWNKRTRRHVSACLWNTQWRNLQNTHYVFLVSRPVNGMSASEFCSRKTLSYNLYIPENLPLIWRQKYHIPWCAEF